MNIDANAQINIDKWLNGPYDDKTKQAIKDLVAQGNEAELNDAFYKNLEFGTGGLRGIMGVGPNRLNTYTVGLATQGFANWLNKHYAGSDISVAISFDSRNNSTLFAKTVADVFSANGITVHIFKELRPTPALSFAVRHFKCQGGVMLTASHNPKEYNGYKAYDEHGCQLVAPYDREVLEEVGKVDVTQVKFTANEDKIKLIPESFDELFINEVVALSANRAAVSKEKDLKIVYTSLHGTGVTMVPKALKTLGFNEVHLVDRECVPDGNFTYVASPNPEEHAALEGAISLAKELDADLCIATDPDCDRVGIAIKDNTGEYILLNGNQIGSLLVHYVAQSYKNDGKLLPNHFIVKTIVTTDLIAKIADSFNVKYYDTLTGFKYIGELITEKEGQEVFLAGGEESYGYLIGSLVRDKDAVVSSNFIAEMVAYYKANNTTLFNALLDLYKEHGLYNEKLISITKKGKEGAEEIVALMNKLRNNEPTGLGGSAVVKIRDFEQLIEKDTATGKETKLDFPKSDVLQFITADGSTISARPSGTEPKIKFYCSVKGNMGNVDNYADEKAALEKRTDEILKELGV